MPRPLAAVLLAGLAVFPPGARAQDDSRPDSIVHRSMAPDRKNTIDGLVANLKDPDELVRQKAAESLGALRPVAVEAVKPLIKALKDKSSIVRNAAVEALGAIGTPKARKAVEKYRKKVGYYKTW